MKLFLHFIYIECVAKFVIEKKMKFKKEKEKNVSLLHWTELFLKIFVLLHCFQSIVSADIGVNLNLLLKIRKIKINCASEDLIQGKFPGQKNLFLLFHFLTRNF